MTFNDFVRKDELKNKATSNIKIQQVLSSLGLNDVGIFIGDGPFESDIGIVNLHLSKGSHWVVYINENYYDSYGCVPPKKLSKFIINDMDIVYIQTTKYKVRQIKEILIVLLIVYI